MITDGYKKQMAGSFALREALLPREDALPFSFEIDGKKIIGIPKEWNRTTLPVKEDETKTVKTVVGTDPGTGIEVRFETTVYHDSAAVEWIAWLKNTSSERTPMITALYGAQLGVSLSSPVLKHCSGDGIGGGGYTESYLPLAEDTVRQIRPCGGRSCSGAFPYFTVLGKDCGCHIVIGWSGQWDAEFKGTKDGFFFSDKQHHTAFRLDPDEDFRTPITLLLPFDGDEEIGRNVWRRFYFAHILPKPYPGFPEPIVFCHEADRPGAEWTNATEEGQVRMIEGFLSRGVPFNAWWIDAGWYTCGGDWGNTGTWVPDPARFPNKMRDIGNICEKNGIRFLLWFEPERLRLVSRDPEIKDEWLFDWVRVNGNGEEEISVQYLFDLGNDEAREWLTDKIDNVIKEAGVKIFRSDYNILPWGHWTANERWNRRGINENKYVRGYHRFWSDLAKRNPGILIDACASGGQRNDLETMRLAVPLQFTDNGIGLNEPFKCAFSRTMFGWLPYFRQHLGYWGGKMDNYAYHLAISPAITYLMPHTAPEETVDYVIRMDPIRDKASRMMLSADYYPLTPDPRRFDSVYAVQFHNEEKDEGLVHVIRHEKNPDDTVTVFPRRIDEEKTYRFVSPEFGKETTLTGKELKEKGFSVSIPQRSGEIWFYSAI